MACWTRKRRVHLRPGGRLSSTVPASIWRIGGRRPKDTVRLPRQPVVGPRFSHDGLRHRTPTCLCLQDWGHGCQVPPPTQSLAVAFVFPPGGSLRSVPIRNWNTSRCPHSLQGHSNEIETEPCHQGLTSTWLLNNQNHLRVRRTKPDTGRLVLGPPGTVR